MPYHMTQKTLDFPRDQPPPTCPRNGSARIKNITVKRPYFDTLFQKTVFFSKIFFGKRPLKFLEVCLNSKYTVCEIEVKFTILTVQGP
jgi:hypothetical protein